MKNIAIITLLLFGYTLVALPQNLVTNASFEIYENCPRTYTENPKKELIPDWYLPTKGTSDYFNSCTNIQVNVPKNFIGYMFAKDGEAYVGMILLELPKDTSKRKVYREYIQSELKEPLVSDKKYVIKFHYAIASYSTYTVNRIGIHFSQKQISKRTSSKVLAYTPQIKAETSCIDDLKDTWYEVTDTIIAKGGERFMTIGNFYSNEETDYKTLDVSDLRNTLKERIKKNRIAYYYIDAISVTPIVEKAAGTKN